MILDLSTPKLEYTKDDIYNITSDDVDEVVFSNSVYGKTNPEATVGLTLDLVHEKLDKITIFPPDKSGYAGLSVKTRNGSQISTIISWTNYNIVLAMAENYAKIPIRELTFNQIDYL